MKVSLSSLASFNPFQLNIVTKKAAKRAKQTITR
jgi:hypothetical protein